MTRKQPKSLQQMAAEADKQVGEHDFVCRRCGCRDTRVAKTWVVEGGAIRRKRVCRHCGQDFTLTSEVPCPRGLKVVVEDEEERERAVA